MIFAPERLLQGFGANLVVKPTNHYCRYLTDSGLQLPDGGDDHIEKKYDIGEVVTHGPAVTIGVMSGVIVIWQCTSAWRLPNGANEVQLFHVPQSAIVAILPNPAHFAGGPSLLGPAIDPEDIELVLSYHEKNSGAGVAIAIQSADAISSEAREKALALIDDAYAQDEARDNPTETELWAALDPADAQDPS